MNTKQNTVDTITMNVDGQFIIVYLMDVHPALAESYLAGNTHNRNLRPKHVDMIAYDMAAGNFKFNGAPILIAEDGTLLDGQHRLHAVIQSGTTVPMMILRGFRTDAQATVDTGAKRLVADVLSLRGDKNSNGLAALAKVAMAWVQGRRNDFVRCTYSTTQTIEFIDQNPDLADAVNRSRAFAQRYQLSKSHMGLAWWVLNRISAEDNAEFWELLMQPQRPPHPIAALQAALLNDLNHRARGHRRVSQHHLAILFKAWNLYITGDTALQLRFKVGGANPERFPEPISPIG
jgi:hypothetical protein